MDGIRQQDPVFIEQTEIHSPRIDAHAFCAARFFRFDKPLLQLAVQFQYIPVKDVLNRIAYLLDCYGISYSRYGDGKKGTMKLSTSFIGEHFDAIPSNRNDAKIKLNRFKDELLS